MVWIRPLQINSHLVTTLNIPLFSDYYYILYRLSKSDFVIVSAHVLAVSYQVGTKLHLCNLKGRYKLTHVLCSFYGCSRQIMTLKAAKLIMEMNRLPARKLFESRTGNRKFIWCGLMVMQVGLYIKWSTCIATT